MTKRFTISIDCVNSAFDDDNCNLEIAKILENQVSQIRWAGEDYARGRIPLFDSNGNYCGWAVFELVS